MSPEFSRRSVAPGRAVTAVPHRYVDDHAALAALVRDLEAAERYAIDTEFHRERTYFPQLALVQLAFEGEIAIVDPLTVDISALAVVLKGHGLAIFHAADQDLEVLERSCGVIPERIFDTQIAAGFLGYSTPSLASLTERLLGARLEKGDQLTDWTHRPLEAAQLAYAANDVAYLLELHDALSSELERRGRTAWAQAEQVALLERSRTAVDPNKSWWRLKQARQLRGRSRGVAQAVAAWRERRAQELDQPVRFILSDLALVAIAQRPPTSRADLERVRGVDSRHLQNTAVAELLEAVERGLVLTNNEIVVPPRPTGEPVAKPAVALAAAWVAERAHELEIDPAILATRADLAAFLQDPPEGRLVNSWRNALVGEPIQRLVAGEASIALVESTIVLEERSHRPFRLEGPEAD